MADRREQQGEWVSHSRSCSRTPCSNSASKDHGGHCRAVRLVMRSVINNKEAPACVRPSACGSKDSYCTDLTDTDLTASLTSSLRPGTQPSRATAPASELRALRAPRSLRSRSSRGWKPQGPVCGEERLPKASRLPASALSGRRRSHRAAGCDVYRTSVVRPAAARRASL